MTGEDLPFNSDELPLEIPPRTSLFRLEPIGIGTPEVESFASWLTRLARTHRVGVRTLLLQILPQSEQKLAVSGRSGRWRVRSNIIDVPSRIAPWLAQATGIEDLSPLSLERWLGLLSGIRLLRRRRAWCPECLRQRPYERLVWTMRDVMVCPTHHLRLLEHCPACDFVLPRLRLGSSLDRCPGCRGWMELFDTGKPVTSEWAFHVAQEAGALAAMDKKTGGNAPAQIAIGLRNALPSWKQGEICTLLGVPDNRFALLRSRNITVPFEFLCRVSFSLGISVPMLLTQHPDSWPVRTPRRGGWMPARRILVKAERETLLARLRHLVEEGCPSLRAASIRLGKARTTLLRHFPTECGELLRRSGNRKAPYFLLINDKGQKVTPAARKSIAEASVR